MLEERDAMRPSPSLTNPTPSQPGSPRPRRRQSRGASVRMDHVSVDVEDVSAEVDRERVEPAPKQIGVEELILLKMQRLFVNAESCLKPYFRITTKAYFRRLIYAMLPRQSTSLETLNDPDLYGPFALFFTLAAILRLVMRHNTELFAEHTHTLIGMSIGIVLGFWLIDICWALTGAAMAARCSQLQQSIGSVVVVAVPRVLCFTGYGLFGHSLVLACGHFGGTVLYYIALFTIGAGNAMCFGMAQYQSMISYQQLAAPWSVLGAMIHTSWIWFVWHQYSS